MDKGLELVPDQYTRGVSYSRHLTSDFKEHNMVRLAPREQKHKTGCVLWSSGSLLYASTETDDARSGVHKCFDAVTGSWVTDLIKQNESGDNLAISNSGTKWFVCDVTITEL